MKSKALAISLLAVTTITGYSNTSFAEQACLEVEEGITAYSVEGRITTENITDTLQIGNINLTVHNGDGEVVFTESGSLAGNITGTDSYGATLLSHVARFPKGNSFVTNGDRAVLTYPFVRATLEDGTPCSFWIQETISNISLGTRFFRQFTGIEVIADGHVSNCSGDNENHFVLSGCLYAE